MPKKAGAKGIHIVGSIETGQEMLQRFEVDDVFVGLMGNWLAIGAVSGNRHSGCFVMEENCSPPAIDQYAEKYQVSLVSVSTIIGVPGVAHELPIIPRRRGNGRSMYKRCHRELKKRHNQIKPWFRGTSKRQSPASQRKLY